MLLKSLLELAPFVTAVVALADCCYLDVTAGGSQLRYRSNSTKGNFYDPPTTRPSGSGSFCGVTITRAKDDEDNCAAATIKAYSGYCSGSDPQPVNCTEEYVVRLSGNGK